MPSMVCIIRLTVLYSISIYKSKRSQIICLNFTRSSHEIHTLLYSKKQVNPFLYTYKRRVREMKQAGQPIQNENN